MSSDWMNGICMDENGLDQTLGGLEAPKKMTREECLNWCKKQSLAVGCEYKLKEETCLGHTFSVSSANGAYGTLCAIVHPKGLFLTSIKEGNSITYIKGTNQNMCC